MQNGPVRAYEAPIAFHRQGHERVSALPSNNIARKNLSVRRPNANKRNTPGEYEFKVPLVSATLTQVALFTPPAFPAPR